MHEDDARIEGRAERNSIASLVNSLIGDIQALVRKEVELARAETGEKVSQMRRGVVSLIAGGIVAFAGFLYLLLAATVALEEVLEPWLAALVVGLVVGLIGLAMLASGQSALKTTNLRPERTMDTLRGDREFVRDQVKGH